MRLPIKKQNKPNVPNVEMPFQVTTTDSKKVAQGKRLVE